MLSSVPELRSDPAVPASPDTPVSPERLAPPERLPSPEMTIPTSVAVPGTRPRIRAVDGMRALAMTMVLSYHTWQFGEAPKLAVPGLGPHFGLGRLLGGFNAGVDLFMVLSGFCLFWPLCIKPAALTAWSWRDYARRRLHRIVPPYYAAIVYCTLLPVVLVGLSYLLHQPDRWQPLPSLWQYATHLLFIHSLFPSAWDGIQPAFWSLSLEAQFYVVFPLVVLAYRKFGIKVALGMTLLSIGYRVPASLATTHSPGIVPFLASVFFLGRWMQFAAGMTAAWLVARSVHADAPYCARTGAALLGAALLAYVAALRPMPPVLALLPMRDLLLAAAFATALVALCASQTLARKLFESRPVVWLGTISYSVFLIHQNTLAYVNVLLRHAFHLAGPARFAVLETAGFAFIVAIAFVFFKMFEAPFMNRAPKRPPTLTQSEGTPALVV